MPWIHGLQSRRSCEISHRGVLGSVNESLQILVSTEHVSVLSSPSVKVIRSMSQTGQAPSQDPRKKLILSRRGLFALTIVLLGAPIALIGAVWATLPPTSETPLPAAPRFEDFVQIDQFQALPASEREDIIEQARKGDFVPSIIVKNESEEDWNNVGVSINRTFDFFSSEPLAAGDEREFLLHQFQTRQGDMFRPLNYQIRELKVSARVASGARALYEAKVDPYGRIQQEGADLEEESSPRGTKSNS